MKVPVVPDVVAANVVANVATNVATNVAAIQRVPRHVGRLLFRTDPDLVDRMAQWLSHAPPDASPPGEFCTPAAAPCFALLRIATREPRLFWGALAAGPVLLVCTLLNWS